MTSKRLETAKKFIGHFETLDNELLRTILAEDYFHQFAPAPMDPPGPFNKEGFLRHHDHLLDVMTGFPVTGKEYIESDIGNQVIVWATSEAFFRDDVKDEELSAADWAYKGEYIFILSMNPTGEKITRTIEFLDSKATVNNLMVLMTRARANISKR